ncbi:hypothetical protein BN2475_40098 [Paraburkholderia ribeironis]|uniref:Uncharacterized protein n=1 Tax=Paraburkholderia ribeironis TaxID=1247936 RepID=A0A1N7RJL6_9BURK|nr:hypothetical protein BN2475_40098 [Paraburkholderia ribeironis]
MLGECRQNVDSQLRGLWHIDGDKLDLRFHQAGNERDVARQAIELRDKQARAGLAAHLKRCAKLRAPGDRIKALTGFSLDELTDQFPLATVEESGGGFPLGFETQTAGPLTCCRNSQVRHELTVCHLDSPSDFISGPSYNV